MSFEKFYLLYPRRINKAQALKTYAKAIKQGATDEQLINCALEYQQWCGRNGTAGEYICHPATWLNPSRWENDYRADDRSKQTRDQAMANERAKQPWQWPRQLKQYRTKRRLAKWNDDRTSMELVYHSEYALPDGMSHQQVFYGLVECIRPCNPMVVQHFVRLQACKPFFETDVERMQIIFDCLYEDLKDFPEVAVILGIDEVRQAKGRYFPSIEEIVTEVSFYRDLIYDVLDFFREA